MPQQFDFQGFLSTTEKDILYGILKACGGDMSDIKQYFIDGRDDLLYAILLMIKANGGNTGGGGGTGANFANTDLTFTGDRTHNANDHDLWIKGWDEEEYSSGVLTMSKFYHMLLNAATIDINSNELNVEAEHMVTISAPLLTYRKYVDEGYDTEFARIYVETTQDNYHHTPYLKLIQRWIGDKYNRINTRFSPEEIEIENVEFGHISRLVFPKVGETGNDSNEFSGTFSGAFVGNLATKEWVTNNPVHSLGNISNPNVTIYQNGQIDIAEAIDLYPDGRADFANGKSRFQSDGGGHLANWAIYWDALGNISNDNNSAWSIGHEGAASFKSIDKTYVDDDGISRRILLSSMAVVGWVDNDGVFDNWHLGTEGISVRHSEDGGDTYISGWSIDAVGNATLNTITAQNDRFRITGEAAYFAGGNFGIDENGSIGLNGNINSLGSITMEGSVSFDNGAISSNGSGNFTAATLNANNGASGSFTSAEGITIEVVNGIITTIVLQQ